MTSSTQPGSATQGSSTAQRVQTVSRDLNAYRFRTKVRVRLSETDAVGIVFFGSFSQYMDVGRMDYLASLGVDEFAGPVPCLPPGAVAHASLDFHESGRYNDELEINVRIAHLGRTSYTFHFLMRDVRRPRVVATGRMTLVWFDDAMKPTPLPDGFRQQVLDYEADGTVAAN